MKSWLLITVFALTFTGALADDDECDYRKIGIDASTACELRKIREEHKVQQAANSIARAAGQRLGDWLQFNKSDRSGTQVVIETALTSIQDATITLKLECSERSGFQMTILGKSSLGVSPHTTAYVLIDGHPPVEMGATQLVPEIDFPALQIKHAEPVERQIIKSKSIQIRYDTRFGGSSSYTFKGANLQVGEKSIMSVCPAP